MIQTVTRREVGMSNDPKLELYLCRVYTSILGLLYHDQCFEPAPEVQEALRRLNLKEPWLFDERKIRLYHAHTLRTHGEQLPKEQWTKWENVCFRFSN